MGKATNEKQRLESINTKIIRANLELVKAHLVNFFLFQVESVNFEENFVCFGFGFRSERGKISLSCHFEVELELHFFRRL